MEFLKKLSLFLLAPPVCLLLFDLVNNWFVHATLEVEKLSYWWKKLSPGTMMQAKSILAMITSTPTAEKIFSMPAPVVLFVPPLFFYLLYRIIFLLQGGKAGGYKSRH